ncbi:putative hydrolase [Paludibacter propionicigenes WB4]|uniref:Putative hydrolase n=1 Tax=Paludibacter propionicigenes (strain DSM 17365 / JCM 13257 / WB4) TaxID=694427 RepID=E4T0C7_PALPW|nr:MBL fold metallo-hydrolase [Paludibacter propionicigenes]ADQ78286.1 putative hydrolase [Paludibacter propionicigenes WB4]
MDILFLGTGTSTGVPEIGCKCETCLSTDIKDKRLRASVLIREGESQILIDAGPDLRQQILTYKIDKLSGVLITHEHYDHIGGIDDLRPLGKSQIYAEKKVCEVIQKNMPYCFGEKRYPGSPIIELHEITDKPFYVNNIEIQPIRVMHARLPIFGFRVGNFAYLTDVKTIEESSIEKLRNLDILVLNALRPAPHMSHISLSEALEITKKIGAKKTFFTHMNHHMGFHNLVNQQLPENIQLAYDGLELKL